jgi:P-type E1-E2 ATPase
MEAQILSPLCVAVGGDVKGLLEIDDVLRPDTSGVLRSLEERGVHDFVLLTGHRQLMAERAAGQLGISRVFPEASPEEKEHVVRRLQAEGRTVAVIGHGITDANAIAAADVGIAMEAGAEVTRGLAHAVLLRGGLHPIPLAIDIGREMVDLLYVNWKIIAYPNTVALALACLGVLGPTGVAILSDGASLLATVNGLRPLIERAEWMRLEQGPTARHPVALPAS